MVSDYVVYKTAELIKLASPDQVGKIIWIMSETNCPDTRRIDEYKRELASKLGTRGAAAKKAKIHKGQILLPGVR